MLRGRRRERRIVLALGAVALAGTAVVVANAQSESPADVFQPEAGMDVAGARMSPADLAVRNRESDVVVASDGVRLRVDGRDVEVSRGTLLGRPAVCVRASGEDGDGTTCNYVADFASRGVMPLVRRASDGTMEVVVLTAPGVDRVTFAGQERALPDHVAVLRGTASEFRDVTFGGRRTVAGDAITPLVTRAVIGNTNVG